MRFFVAFLYILVLSFCLGQFGRFPFFGQEVNLYVWDILAVTLVCSWLVYKLGIKKSLELPPKWLPLTVFTSVGFITLINGLRWVSLGEWFVSFGYLARWVLYAGIYFVAVDLFKGDKDNRKQLINIIIVSGVILAFLGFIQLATFPDLSQLDPELGWDPHKNRLVSTWLDPNFLGAYFVLCLSLLTSKFFVAIENGGDLRRSKNGFSQIFLLATCYLILATGLFLTFSRSAWAMLAVVIGVFGIFKSRKLLVLMGFVFFAAYFFVPRVQTRVAGITDPADSARFRLISWQRTWKIIKKHPFLGVGFNAFRYAQERAGYFQTERGVPIQSGHSGAGSDSSLLLVWATTGFFGLLAYVWLYGSVAWQAFRKQAEKGAGESCYVSLSFLAILAGIFVESNFINSLFFPPIAICLWFLIAIVVVN